LCAALEGIPSSKDLSGLDGRDSPRPHWHRHLFMGIDISRFVSLKEREKAHLASKRAREVGIPLSESAQRDLRFLREELAVTGLALPFSRV